MTMKAINEDNVHIALANQVDQSIKALLQNSQPGHCLRISTLPVNVMRKLCDYYNQEEVLDAYVVFLLSHRQTSTERWEVTATKLIELRNIEDKPLLAFIPPGVKAAAEDSFDISTFREVDLSDIPQRLSAHLRQMLPDQLQQLTDDVIDYLSKSIKSISHDDVVRYYLTILQNKPSIEIAGGAIYQFRLIPDFKLFDIADRVRQRIDRNHNSIAGLTDFSAPLLGRIYNLKLEDNSLQSTLYSFLNGRILEGVHFWTEKIATVPEHSHLSFDRWRFVGEQDKGQLLLYVHDIDLPTQNEDEPAGADNPQYLDVNHTRNLKVKWETNPKPATVAHLTHFRIELINTDGIVVWESNNIKNSSSPRAYRTKTLKIIDFRELVEDDIYFFRVRAYNEVGEILNEEDPEENPKILRDKDNPSGKRINESDDIWFWVDDKIPPPVDPQKNVSVDSLLEARLISQFNALDRGENPLNNLTPNEKSGWTTTNPKRADANYNVVYDAQARYTISVNNLLMRSQVSSLRKPETLGRLRLDFRNERTKFDNVNIDSRNFPPDIVPVGFLNIRSKLFTKIIGDQKNKVVETSDLLEFQDLVFQYADEYLSWIEIQLADSRAINTDFPVYLDVDTIELLLPENERAYLMSPLHPIRLLWHLQHARLANDWLRKSMQLDEPSKYMQNSSREYLLENCIPVNLPPIMRISHGSSNNTLSRFYVEQGPISKYWSLYVREDTKDKQSLRARVMNSLGFSSSSATKHNLTAINHNTILQKFLRYLIQHPYNTTLKINVFNPGKASLVVDAILGIEKDRAKNNRPSLRYEIHLFTRSSDTDDIGLAFQELIDPQRQVTPEADAFTIPSKNHLFPKLRFSKNTVAEFLEAPEQFEAHISILRDVFPVDINPEPIYSGRSSFNHGLIQQQYLQFVGDENYFAWKRQLIPGETAELDENGVSNIIGEMLYKLGILQSSIAIGKPVDDLMPTLRLDLPLIEKNLLFQVHSYSDWVFLLDKYLGLDYFDSAVRKDRPIYLLDFVPEFAGTDSERLLLTTRSTTEVSRIIKPVLEKHDLYWEEGVEIFYLDLLRSLSGKLAFKLLSSPNHVSEAISLALARLFLEQYHLLDNAILIPLDAHASLFSETLKDSLEDEVSLSRSDLLLVTADTVDRNLNFHVVEVKWRSDLSDYSTYIDLVQKIDEQISNSHLTLRKHFDLHLDPIDRIDRQLKNKQLISLLDFYLDRSFRYGLVDESEIQNFKEFIYSLDYGYRMSISGSGLIFDLAFDGISTHYEHEGLFFNRLGRNYLIKLLSNGIKRYKTLVMEVKTSASLEEEISRNETVKVELEDTTMREDASFADVHGAFPKTIHPQDYSHTEIQNPVVDAKNNAESTKISSADKVITNDPEPPNQVEEQHDSTKQSSSNAIPKHDILLGVDRNASEQFGIIGQASGQTVALDLNETNTISLFGVQGGGKSYTVGTIVEMATQAFDNISLLPAPLASVIFHFHENQDYQPEFVSMVDANDETRQLTLLKELYGANPEALDDVLLLTSRDKIEKRRLEFPGISVEPILFSSNELTIKDWRFLMGALGNQMYMKQINLIMRTLRENLTLNTLQREIENSDLTDNQKNIARIRLNFAAEFINDNHRLADRLQPGRLIIVDLRDEFIDKDEALGLFVVMLNIFANAGLGNKFNKLIVFDEAHKYMSNRDLTSHIVDVIRQMRHQGVSLLIASQDPPSLPTEIIELSTIVILHRMNSPQWLRHLQKSITALANLKSSQMASLRPGEAFVWSTKSSERAFTQSAIKMNLRPRVTRHGGGTKTAN